MTDAEDESCTSAGEGEPQSPKDTTVTLLPAASDEGSWSAGPCVCIEGVSEYEL